MNPSLGNVSTVLLYALPGFLAVQLYRTFYPAKRQSQFEIIVHSLLHSFIIHVGLYYVACLLGLEYFTLSPAQTSVAIIKPQTILPLLVGGLVWGYLLIAYHRWIRVRLFFLPKPAPLAIWPIVATNAPKDDLWVLVCTKQGVRYFGWLAQHSFDPAAEDHDFLLRPAYRVDSNHNDLYLTRNLLGGGVYLNTRDIESLEMNSVHEWRKVFQQPHSRDSQTE